MRFQEVNYKSMPAIDGYGAEFFRIGGQVFQGAILVLPGGVRPWGGFEDTAALLATQVDVLFLGTGAETRHLPEPLRGVLRGAHVAAEPMATGAACRSYNVLLGEGRRVGAALLPASAIW